MTLQGSTGNRGVTPYLELVRTSCSIKSSSVERRSIHGVYLSFPSFQVVEILAREPIDFIYLDGEHGAFESRDIEMACIAAERHGVTVIARLPDGSRSTITRFLDRGVRGLIIPHVSSARQAADIVNAAYYAPLGTRAFGGGRPDFMIVDDLPAYMAVCNTDVSIGIMLECVTGLDAASAIAAVEGIDYIFVGMHDLAQSMGFPGRPDHPDVVAAARKAEEAVRSSGIPLRDDFMRFAWINTILSDGLRAALPR